MQQLYKIQKHLNYVDSTYIARSQAGYPIARSQWTNLLKRICQRANIDKPISPHELRHTYATLCLSQGVSLLALSKQMGHANMQETHRYIHLLKKEEEQAQEIIEDLY